MSKNREPATPSVPQAAEKWVLRLYIAGHSPKCLVAIRNLTRFCAEHLEGRYRIEVVDLLENPRLAHDHQIVAVPTLVRKMPEPLRRVIGDLSDTHRMLVGLDLQLVEQRDASS